MPNQYDNLSYNSQGQPQPPKALEGQGHSYERRYKDRREYDNSKAKQRDAELYLTAIGVENQEKNRLKQLSNTTEKNVSAYHQTARTHANWQISGTHHIKTL